MKSEYKEPFRWTDANRDAFCAPLRKASSGAGYSAALKLQVTHQWADFGSWGDEAAITFCGWLDIANAVSVGGVPFSLQIASADSDLAFEQPEDARRSPACGHLVLVTHESRYFTPDGVRIVLVLDCDRFRELCKALESHAAPSGPRIVVMLRSVEEFDSHAPRFLVTGYRLRVWPMAYEAR